MANDCGVTPYDFFAPSRIIFGWGVRSRLPHECSRLGNQAWIVCGSRTLLAADEFAQIVNSLTNAGIRIGDIVVISREPTTTDVDELTDRLRLNGVSTQRGDVILGIGGGSAIDLAKAVAAMVVQDPPGSVYDFLEGVGGGRQVCQMPIPFIAMPTTGGTGSEVTKNAVISHLKPALKRSLRADSMLARSVIVDPELSSTTPAHQTSASGMDAVTQLIESFVSNRKKPIPRALALDAVGVALRALPCAVERPMDRSSREAMSHAALISGLCLANSGLGMAHGVAAALGVHCGVPHGVACAMMLPASIRANRSIAEADYAQIAHAVFASPPSTQAAAVERLIDHLEQMLDRFGLPRGLSKIGVREDLIPQIVRDAKGNSMNGNPRTINDDELTTILWSML